MLNIQAPVVPQQPIRDNIQVINDSLNSEPPTESFIVDESRVTESYCATGEVKNHVDISKISEI